MIPGRHSDGFPEERRTVLTAMSNVEGVERDEAQITRQIRESIAELYRPHLKLHSAWFHDQNGYIYIGLFENDEPLPPGIDENAIPRKPAKFLATRADWLLVAHCLLADARRRIGYVGLGKRVIRDTEQAIHDLASLGHGNDVVRRMKSPRTRKLGREAA